MTLLDDPIVFNWRPPVVEVGAIKYETSRHEGVN